MGSRAPQGLSWLLLAGAAVLCACGDQAAPPATTAPTVASQPAVSSPPQASTPSEPPSPAPVDERRQRREERTGERLRAAEAAGAIDVAEAQRRHAHGRVVEFDGRVKRLLPEDRKGLQHQRFLLTVEGAGTVLIAHNTDLAGHVPVAVGDLVRVHGIFEWNAKGGVVHWTHHDPRGRTAGGWIRHDGKTYR
jgi:hypothetical protein